MVSMESRKMTTFPLQEFLPGMTQYSFISELAGILSNKLCNDNVFPSYLGCTLVGDDLQLFLAVTTVTGTAMYDCNARQHWCRWGSCLANKVHVYKALRHVTGFVRLPVPSLLLFVSIFLRN